MSASCLYCRQTEVSAWLLSNNHGTGAPSTETGYSWPIANGMCVAMSLTRNHCVSYARHRNLDALADAVERAEVLWANADASWLDEFRRRLARVAPPAHATVALSEQDDLFGALT